MSSINKSSSCFFRCLHSSPPVSGFSCSPLPLPLLSHSSLHLSRLRVNHNSLSGLPLHFCKYPCISVCFNSKGTSVLLSHRRYGILNSLRAEQKFSFRSFNLKSHCVFCHIEFEELIANGEVEGITKISNLNEWPDGDYLDQERLWKK